MKYRYTIKCGHKTYQIELTILHIDEDEPEDLTERFLNQCIERDKVKDGLSGIPHSIAKVEFSLDGESWIEMER